MKCFFEEGRALAKLSHPNVIRVLNFFRANDTVYMVMEYEQGRTLQEMIQKNRAIITEKLHPQRVHQAAQRSARSTFA